MLDRFRPFVLAALLASSPAWAQAPEVRNAIRGDAVSGVVLSDDGSVLRLDTTPCASSRTVVVFHRPYTREAAGTIRCGSTPRDVVQVIQQ
jgi:hypothetical protein